MNLQDIVEQLQLERSQIERAIAALEGLTSTHARRRGRPPKSSAANGQRRRVMSASARKRISDAMKARWAAGKTGTGPSQSAKVSTKKVARRPRMSAAARKKLSTLMKARWAARKKQASTK